MSETDTEAGRNRRRLGAIVWMLLLGAVVGGFWYVSHREEERKQDEVRCAVNQGLDDMRDAACRAKRALGERCN